MQAYFEPEPAFSISMPQPVFEISIVYKKKTNKKCKILIVEILSNKSLNPILTELFISGRKLSISLVFITQSYFSVRKNIRPNSTHYFIMKVPNKRKFQQIALNHSSDTDFQVFMNLYKKCTGKQYSFLVINALLASDNPLRFRKNIKTNHDKRK